jgi:hypothetical protein
VRAADPGFGDPVAVADIGCDHGSLGGAKGLPVGGITIPTMKGRAPEQRSIEAALADVGPAVVEFDNAGRWLADAPLADMEPLAAEVRAFNEATSVTSCWSSTAGGAGFHPVERPSLMKPRAKLQSASSWRKSACTPSC